MSSTIGVQNIAHTNGTNAMTVASDGVVAFNNNPTGITIPASDFKLLLSDTISSSVAQYDISSTYMNSTYDNYVLQATLLPTSDNTHALMRVFENGSVVTGDKYSYEVAANSSSVYANSNSVHRFQFTVTQVGNAVGEGISYNIRMTNVNSTTHAFSYGGESQGFANAGQPISQTLGGSLLVANRAIVVNGLRLTFESGNIASGTIKFYGVA